MTERTATRCPAIFLDDGGVISDNAVRAAQWPGLVGAHLAPRLGGAEEAWAEANRAICPPLWREWGQRLQDDPTADAVALRWYYDEEWVRRMCAFVGVSAPASSEACLRLADDTSRFVIPRVRGAFPGAPEAIRQLHGLGYRLHTASGEDSRELALYMDGIGVRDCFGALYGPDLIGIAKAGPEYYARIFRHAGTAAGGTLVVDDREDALDWAAEAGARTVLCGPDWPRSQLHQHVVSLAQLPALLDGGLREVVA